MGQKNNQKRSLIPTSASQNSAPTTFIDKNVAVMQGWKKDSNNANIFLSIRFVQNDFECFSEWQKAEMGLFGILMNVSIIAHGLKFTLNLVKPINLV